MTTTTLRLNPYAGWTLTAIRAEIRSTWGSITDRADLAQTPRLPKTPKLLGSSTKTRKGDATYAVRVIYMAPDREAFRPDDRRTLCGAASAACSLLCLGHSTGHLQWSHARAARAWKTALMLGNRQLFRALLDAEIRGHDAACRKAGTVAVIRVDGSSDTGEGKRSALRNPTVQHYDYTKRLGAALGSNPANYCLVFSWSGANVLECTRALAAGVNVAVPFSTPKGDALPSEFLGREVIDGDESDLRFTDRTGGLVVGLRFKAGSNRGAGIRKSDGFVVRV